VISATDWLAARAKISGAQPALEFRGSSLSYTELLGEVRSAAASLLELDVERGDVVAALLPNGAAFAVLLHATAACGAVLLPLNVRLTAHEITQQLRDADAGLLVHGAGPLASLANTVAAALPRLRTIACADDQHLFRSAPVVATAATKIEAEASADGDPLAILFTSGTSGTPKGAELTRGNFVWSATASAFHLGVSRGDRWLACMPLYHVGGLSILLRAVLYGNAVVIHERFDPAAVNAALDGGHITCTSLVATMLARLLDERGDRPAPPQLRFVLLGGGPAPAGLIERAHSLGFPVAATYGLTEAASQVATCIPREPSETPNGGLRPLLGCEVRVVDIEDDDLPDGVAGELLVRGPGVMRGYVNQPEATATALRGGWLHTGDVGLRAKDGSLTILDRRSDLILSGGENVYPSEVEAVLCAHPAVAEAAVAAVPDADFGQRPAAWLVYRPGIPRDEEPLRAFCRERLAGYKVPVAFHAVTQLPRTASGKLKRRELA